ncbi:DUF2959 domain-containing protein [Modicisalibacter luteus]|uniref:DUF2959 domain-containing protein n=1 Tax=Modicisalibacter luteus TaxID=453962 RepID=A0ABV7LZT1_9GAMM|nr:DUF2959 domain-containing protein [Halomonas lutea]GHA94425.1 DNA repair ATPase [Halomonas lutea]
MTRRTRHQRAAGWLWPLLLVVLVGMTGCQSAYFSALEKVGIHKRDVLVDRVEEGRDAQQAAQEQFSSALEQFRAVVQVPESELSQTYDRLNAEYEDSEAAAKRVEARIESIEDVAEALFDEWEDELSLYQSADYRRLSERQLRDTRVRYAEMIEAMHDAADSMQPVLLAMRDNMLFLKHNLNARAIGALRGEVEGLERDVAALRQRMQAAIARSDAFIAELGSHDAP